ncbi:hypothetical protein [Crucivirus-472]|nr:hypothetical protein [Crucivirus-472]
MKLLRIGAIKHSGIWNRKLTLNATPQMKVIIVMLIPEQVMSCKALQPKLVLCTSACINRHLVYVYNIQRGLLSIVAILNITHKCVRPITDLNRNIIIARSSFSDQSINFKFVSQNFRSLLFIRTLLRAFCAYLIHVLASTSGHLPCIAIIFPLW